MRGAKGTTFDGEERSAPGNESEAALGGSCVRRGETMRALTPFAYPVVGRILEKLTGWAGRAVARGRSSAASLMASTPAFPRSSAGLNVSATNAGRGALPGGRSIQRDG